MGKDQYHVQTLRTLYLHGILLPQDLFIAKRNALKRASQWSLCYESPKKEQVSHAFKHLVANIKSYNADKI